MLFKLRHFFAAEEIHLRLYLLATLTGLAAGGIIVLFRLLIDHSQMAVFPSGQVEDFGQMSWLWILGMPTVGGLLIGLLFYRLDRQQQGTGVIHVIERLSYHEGRMPIKNFVRQFIGGAIALISGHSVGRESPSVHLGAASGSGLASQLDLPSNATRILVASGGAAAIAASFDTPIAGVIFAMEVIMMEYHIGSFIPVILASVSGAVVGRVVFDAPPFYGLVAGQMQSLWELPYIIALGLCLGLLAVGFIKSLSFFADFQARYPIWLRTTVAGFLVGCGGLMMPDVMGMSYNLLNTAYLTELAIASLLIMLVLKLVLSSACVGLGVPGGLIGPTLVMGAVAGAILGHIGQLWLPELSSSIGFYAMIGMCAMMAATLKAPLAALMALLELTANPHIILPGMLAIVFSSIVVVEIYKLDSVFLVLLRKNGLDYRNTPLAQALRRINVTKAMQRKFVELGQMISREEAKQALASNPFWIIITPSEGDKRLMLAADLALALNEEGEDEVDLLQIPASRRNLAKVSFHLSLDAAAKQLTQSDAEALYVTKRISILEEQTMGVLTKENIEAQYQLAYEG